MDIKTGSYTGNGVDDRLITGVGFTPVLLITINVTTGAWVWKSSSMAGDLSLAMVGSATVTNRIQALNSDGFELGTDTSVNGNGTSYHYIAFAADTAVLDVGSYTGNGIDDTNITAGLTPVIVYTQGGSGASALSGNWRNSTMAGDLSFRIHTATAASANRIQSLGTNAFQVGTELEVNENTTTFYYFAFAANTAQVSVGSYVGNNTDNRDITTNPALLPSWVWNRRQATANQRGSIMKLTPHAGGVSNVINVGEQGDAIQALNTNGFQVGTDYYVNGDDGGGASVNTYFYFTIAGPATAATIPVLPTIPSGGGWAFLPYSAYQRYKGVRALTEALRNAKIGP